MSSPKEHKRANTYEGPQMTFKFPSEEDLEKSKQMEQVTRLEGPKVTPFIDYQKSKSPQLQDSQLNSPPNSPENQHIPMRSKESSYFPHPESTYTNSTTSSHNYAYSFANSNTSSEGTIPTQSNATTQITRNTASVYEPDIESRGGTVIRHRVQGPLLKPQRSASIGRTSSVIQRRQLAGNALKAQRQGSTKRTISLKRTSSKTRDISSASDEDRSLYEKGSLKRSKAVRYTIGWLTQLRQMGSKMRKGLKKWRLVSLKKVFRFNRSPTIKVKKNNISMPLERDRAQSISELRRAIDDWSRPNDIATIGQVPPPPVQQYRNISASSTSLVNTGSNSIARVPPPMPPPHRIASNKSMQRLIQDQERRRMSGRLVSNELDQPALREPLDQQYRLTFQQDELHYPSKPATVYDDDSTGFNNYSALEDGFDPDSDDNETIAENFEEQERMLREYWRHYLRAMVAHRIETKLEFHKLSQIPEPRQQQVAAEEMFGSLSDLDDADSLYSGETVSESNSWTSVSSTDVSESSLPSQTSTSYFSAYGGPVATPLDIMRYQLAYGSRYRDIVQVKRSSTLPINKEKTETRHTMFEIEHPGHMRFLSVVN